MVTLSHQLIATGWRCLTLPRNSFSSVQLSESIEKRIKDNVIPNYCLLLLEKLFLSLSEEGFSGRIKFIDEKYFLILIEN